MYKVKDQHATIPQSTFVELYCMVWHQNIVHVIATATIISKMQYTSLPYMLY